MTKHNKATSQHGFTLIELMIVVAIIGVLASIAVPEYSQYIRESRRADAITSMQQMLSQQELYYANNNSRYTDQVTNLGYAIHQNPTTTLSREQYYAVRIQPCDGTANGLANCINLTATPIAGTTQENDLACQTISVTSQGLRTALNNEADRSDNICWKS